MHYKMTGEPAEDDYEEHLASVQEAAISNLRVSHMDRRALNSPVAMLDRRAGYQRRRLVSTLEYAALRGEV